MAATEEDELWPMSASRFRFLRRVSPVIERVLARYESAIPPDEIALAIIADLERKAGPSPASQRERLLRECFYQPHCWLCALPIPLDAPRGAPESFSIDHVVPKRSGGALLGFNNLKPAHRFCNAFREVRRMSKKAIRRHAEFMRRVQSLGLCRQLNLFECEASRPPARQASKAG